MAATATGEHEMDQPSPAAGVQTEPYLMVVDDEASTASIVSKYLRESGYRDVLTLVDSRQVLPMMFKLRPGMLLLDLCMPEVSGLDILTALRADEALASTPVVVMTASSDENLVAEIQRLGVSAVLHKPLEEVQLVEAVRSALADN